MSPLVLVGLKGVTSERFGRVFHLIGKVIRFKNGGLRHILLNNHRLRGVFVEEVSGGLPVVDDCSTDDDVRSGTAFWQKSGIAIHPIKYLRNTENLGFAKSMNRGYKVSTGKIVVFYSNDVVMRGNVVGETVRLLEETEKKSLVGGRSVYWNSGWNNFTVNGKEIIVPYLEGYYVAGKRESFEELGGWDERYAPNDYEDVDLSLNAFLLGYNLITLNNLYIQHLSGQTAGMNPNREEITKRNRVKFMEKWQDRLREL